MPLPKNILQYIQSFVPEQSTKKYWKVCFDSVIGELSQRGIKYWKFHSISWALGRKRSSLFLHEISSRRNGFRVEIVPIVTQSPYIIYEYGTPNIDIVSYPLTPLVWGGLELRV